jgi:hypothetical protein
MNKLKVSFCISLKGWKVCLNPRPDTCGNKPGVVAANNNKGTSRLRRRGMN